jgi:hypothetical protein
MAVTVTEIATVFGSPPASEKAYNMTVATVLFDDSYPTGGEALAASDFSDLSSISNIIVGSNTTAGISARWDQANSKLILFDEDDTSGIEAQFANTGDASAITVTIMAVGPSAGL